mmetsp:Transcript_123941/g.321961  ORF Transcript_123941/g.321961 Transcript_123941/m.321961 type:complete len:218 (+) Transcript_123941:1229-1882(+)
MNSACKFCSSLCHCSISAFLSLSWSWHSLMLCMIAVLSWRHFVAFLRRASSFSSSSFKVSSSSYKTNNFMSAFFKSLSNFAFSFSMEATASLKVSMTCRMCSSSCDLSCQRRACASSDTALPSRPEMSDFSCRIAVLIVSRAMRRAASAERPATGALCRPTSACVVDFFDWRCFLPRWPVADEASSSSSSSSSSHKLAGGMKLVEAAAKGAEFSPVA